MTTSNGIIGIRETNGLRGDLFNYSHDSKEGRGLQFGYWMAHKGVSVISYPANVVGLGLGIAGMIVPGCLLGLVKAAIFAATLGNYKPTFSSGFLRCGRAALHSLEHLIVNSFELLYDIENALYNGYRVIRWIGKKLHLDFIKEIFIRAARLIEYVWNTVISPCLEFLGRRLVDGLKKAVDCEREYYTSNFETPSFIRPLDDRTKATRIDLVAEERSYGNIFSHYGYSVVNIPVNLVTAAGTGTISVLTGCCFVAKVLLCATTTINVSIPTTVGKTLEKTFVCTRNVIWDGYTDVADSFILTYKVSKAIGILNVLAKIRDVVLYIPEAIFT